MYSSDYSILCFTETWLSDRIFNNEVFRRDRPLRQGGGVLIAIRDCTSFIPPQDLEVVCVVIRVPQPVTLCCVYVPPNAPIDYHESLHKI